MDGGTKTTARPRLDWVAVTAGPMAADGAPGNWRAGGKLIGAADTLRPARTGVLGGGNR